MGTIFELSVDDLYSLVLTLKPNLDQRFVDKDDVPSLQSKVTEWLLLNGLSTLHKFNRDDQEKWRIPQRVDDCTSCRNFKLQHKFIPSVVVNQPLPTGENLVTFDVKNPLDAAEKTSYCGASIEKIGSQSKDYYNSLSECLMACIGCCFDPFRRCCSDITPGSSGNTAKSTVRT